MQAGLRLDNTGAGMLATANLAVMGMWAGWFPPHRRGLASGIAVTGSSLALIATGPLVPQLIASFGAAGWRVSWYVFGAATLVIALLCFVVIRSGHQAGTVDLGTAYGVPAPAPAGGLQWGLVYRSGAVWHLGLVYIAFGFSYIIYMTFFVKRLVAEGGYSREAAGALFMTMGWASLVCGLIWGAVSDRIGRRWAMVIVSLIHTVWVLPRLRRGEQENKGVTVVSLRFPSFPFFGR
jgi:nitrate/nitrite transporter NarK